MKRSLCSALAAALVAATTAGGFAQSTSPPRAASPGPKFELPLAVIKAPDEVTGTIREVNGTKLVIETRRGQTIQVDAADAIRHQQSGVLVVGRPIEVRGSLDANRVLHAQAIVRAKPTPATWTPDRLTTPR